jgi:hypothetical protein
LLFALLLHCAGHLAGGRMSIITFSAGERGALDYALIAVAGLAVMAFLGLGLYGSGTGFLQSAAYYKANDVVSLCCAAISAGCGLFLMLELAPAPHGRITFAVVIICGMFGYFAVSKGIPAAVTNSYGKSGSVLFEITRFDGGGKGCAATVVASNTRYEDFRQCIKYFDGRLKPEVGRHVDVRGKISSWGIARTDYYVVP